MGHPPSFRATGVARRACILRPRFPGCPDAHSPADVVLLDGKSRLRESVDWLTSRPTRSQHDATAQTVSKPTEDPVLAVPRHDAPNPQCPFVVPLPNGPHLGPLEESVHSRHEVARRATWSHHVPLIRGPLFRNLVGEPHLCCPLPSHARRFIISRILP